MCLADEYFDGVYGSEYRAVKAESEQDTGFYGRAAARLTDKLQAAEAENKEYRSEVDALKTQVDALTDANREWALSDAKTRSGWFIQRVRELQAQVDALTGSREEWKYEAKAATARCERYAVSLKKISDTASDIYIRRIAEQALANDDEVRK